MRGNPKSIFLSALLLLMCGCAALPDANRIQNNMDQMVYHMGVMSSGMPYMADSTRRMADNADQMKGKVDGFIADLQKNRKTLERVVQNYTQSFIDSDKARNTNLELIRRELADLKEALRKSSGPVQGQNPSTVNKDAQAGLRDIESRLETLSSRIKQLEKKSP